MAGLAAALNAPDAIDAIAWALAARGADGAMCRLTGQNGADLAVAVRAGMPAIPRVVAATDDATPDQDAVPIAAFVIDGIASVTALDRGYAENGPSGLIDGGAEPYAAILADAERDELVLARNGAGPGLYYARFGEGWVVASEPASLVHAGVACDPDTVTVRKFITAGECDESERTFFARIRQVRPGEAVVLPAGGRGIRRSAPGFNRSEVGPDQAIYDATAGSRVGVLVSPGLAGAAVLGAALNRTQRLNPLPVYSAVWADIGEGADRSPEVLVRLPDGTLRHGRHTIAPAKPEFDRFLADVGEPVPDLGFYAMWTVARDLNGEIDTLVDSFGGTDAGLERVADRLLARFGVSVRCPFRDAPGETEVLADIAGSTLPASTALQAAADPARVPTAAEVVLSLGDEMAAVLVTARPWSDPAADVATLRRLHAGEDVDVEPLLRAYFVERWLAIAGALAGPPDPPPIPAETVRRRVTAAADITVDDQTWQRLAVRTAPVGPGEQVLASAAWTLANIVPEVGPELFAGPWFAVLSGKAVAVSQRRVSPVLDVVPRRAARFLARLARRRRPGWGEAWTMQVAIDHCGLGRMVGAVLLGASLSPDEELYPPRPDAMAPGDTAVIRAPFLPNDVAASLVAALKLALPRDAVATLAGAAVVSADEEECRVLGYAGGPDAEAVPRARTLLSVILADNPAGQGEEGTPLVLVASVVPAPVQRRDYARLDVRRDVSRR